MKKHKASKSNPSPKPKKKPGRSPPKRRRWRWPSWLGRLARQVALGGVLVGGGFWAGQASPDDLVQLRSVAQVAGEVLKFTRELRRWR